MGKRVFWFLLAWMVMVSLAGGGVNAQEPIVIKAVTYAPPNHISVDPVLILIDKINTLGKGRVKIDLIGGPEVIAPFDMPQALKSGAIDMVAYIPMSYMKSIVPEAEAKGVSEIAEWEERKSGAYDLWCEIFAKKGNIKYLGRFHSLSPFRVYCNKKIEKIADFKGMKMRVNPLYIPFMKALGVAPVSAPPTEIYTLLERKVVEGTMWPTHGMISFGFHKLLKYAIEPGVFQIDTSTHMNLDKWNKLPKDVQDLIMGVMQDMEWIGSMRGMVRTEAEGNVKKRAGMQFIQLPKEEAETFQKIAYEKTWEYIIGISPEYGPKLKKLTQKAAVPKGSFPWMVDF